MTCIPYWVHTSATTAVVISLSGQTQKLALHDLKDDADRTVKHAEVHGTFVVQRMHSHSGLNTVEEMPSEYMWDMVTSFEKRLGQYIQVIL